MLLSVEDVSFQLPVLETGFTCDEVEELLSLLSSEDSGTPNSGSEGSNREAYTVDEKKRRRMISNRESARRSRWRKKRHLENLTEELNQLKVQNRELKTKLSWALSKSQLVWRENEQLTSEFVALWGKLSQLNQISAAMHSQ
ncbi:basic leucine zipper 4-like [Mangifera indica]|uniref:basic leucine zipper 4-like n=1 Tax=Mangifera indica TaxID=29780 RepID=UPI001CFC062B|nr:basic leucine zipper 4-like [Mangifera indica]